MSTVPAKFKIAIIGGGVVGLTLAYELVQKSKNVTVTIIEKELAVAQHASGRNSGVLHAGFYYSPNSLRAQVCRDGNALLRNFIQTNRLPIKNTGKVVVTKNSTDEDLLEKLHLTGLNNGIKVEILPNRLLMEIEPLARTFENFLWSPNSAIFDTQAVVDCLVIQLKNAGVIFRLGCEAKVTDDRRLLLDGTVEDFDHIVNCSGTFADVFAHKFGFGSDFSLLPFAGRYLKIEATHLPLNCLVYPVPDPRNPFLGVHLTPTLNGFVKIGPTALPLFGREQYRLRDIPSLRDSLQSILGLMRFGFSDPKNLFDLVTTELPKLQTRKVVLSAQELVSKPILDAKRYTVRPGIRAQLIHNSTGVLVSDFIHEGDSRSTHILNSISPAWTSSFALSRLLVNDRLLPLID